MADEIKVGRLVAEIVLESETKKAEQEVAQSANNIKNTLKDVSNTNTNIKLSVDSASAINETKEVQKEIQSYLDNNLSVVSDPESYRGLLNNLLTPDKPLEIPVAVIPESTSADDMLQKISEHLSSIGIGATDVKKIMDSCFGDLSVYSQYEKQLNIIAAKLEQQRSKVAELENEQKKLASISNLSDTQVKNAEKITQKYEQEIIKLQQLENQFDKAVTAQDNYVNRKVASYQKGVAEAEKANLREQQLAEQTIQKQQQIANRIAQRTNSANISLAVVDLTTSLRTLNTIAPGTINNITLIIRNINLMKRAFTSAASSPLAVATGVTAIVGTIATLAINYYNGLMEKQEEVRKNAVEMADDYAESCETINDISTEYVGLKSKLDSVTLSHSDEIDVKEKLLNVQKELVENYGAEADNIDLVNGKVDEEINKLQDLQKLKAIAYVENNKENYETAESKLNRERTFAIGDIDIINDKELAEKVEQDLRELFQAEDISVGLGVKLDYNDAEQELGDIVNYYQELLDTQQISLEEHTKLMASLNKSIGSLPFDEINEWQDVITQYENAQDTISGKNENLAESFQDVYEVIVNNLSAVESASSAYEKLSSGENLDSSALLDLCDLYPQLTTYIAETGDVSLRNGEKIKQAQKDMLEANIKSLASERQLLQAKEKRNDDEEKMLTDITSTLAVYRAELENINGTAVEPEIKLNVDDFASAANDLGSAYATLVDSKKLDADTTLDLIKKYPDFAKALNNGSDSVDSQTKAVETLFNAKKNEMLMSLQADQSELESLVNTTNAKIAEYDRLIEKYSYIGSAVIDYKNAQAELTKEAGEYNEKLEQTKAQIAAIKGISLDDYMKEKSTSKINEKLQEQLNLINHRRALNNLSYQEEISWLQMLYNQYAETAEERMQLEEKIYTAQQNLIKEQEDAIKEQEQAYSDLYNEQLDQIEHLKNMDSLSKQQELAWLQTLYSQYVLTAEERMQLEEKIYSTQKSIREDEEQAIKDAMQAELDLLEHEKSMDRLSAESELNWLQRINDSYSMSVEDRRSMELKLYNAKKACEEEMQKIQQETLDNALNALEKRRNSSRITYEEEIKRLREIYNTYKLTAEQQQQVLEKIRSVSSSAKSDRSSQFATMGDGVVEALRNKYQEQRDLEEKVINDSIDSWKNWEDETVSAIQSQIDALDALADAQDSEKERQEYENKRQATELQLAYEKDDYNRKQLQKELARLDNEESERLAEEQRKQQKKELQAQIDAAKDQSSAQQDLLNAELEAIAQNYDKLMSTYNLENEAYRMMLSKNQNEIVNFIASYAPEYELAGQTLGEKLYQGMKNKIANIDWYFKNLQIIWQGYSNTTARVANEAVDQFWASRAEYERQLNSMTATPNINLTVNFNEPVESPVQVARKMEDVTQNLVNQLKK